MILPAETDIFSAFNYCPFDKTKVVIIGQGIQFEYPFKKRRANLPTMLDPYHGLGQAHGLSFSVQYGVATPPSLQNIYKELASDTALAPVFTVPNHGNLSPWATRGVLLLNAVLTVQLKTANAHQGKGNECNLPIAMMVTPVTCRLGTLHRRSHQTPLSRADWTRLLAVGQVRAGQSDAHRPTRECHCPRRYAPN